MTTREETPLIKDLIAARADKKDPWVAVEFFPPKTEVGVTNLKKKLGAGGSFKNLKLKGSGEGILYTDFTWGAGGSTSDLTLQLTQEAQAEFGYIANMHLTCTNMPRKKLDVALEECKKTGIRNILALRGDPPQGQTDFKAVETGFSCALDLVKHIRQEYGDYFCISAAAYPEGHCDRIKKVLAGQSLTQAELKRSVIMEDGLYVCSDIDFEEELKYLKEKQDAGANMFVTQMFFDVQVYLDFVKVCRENGITVPIVPGIIALTSYGGFKRMISFCKSRVPKEMLEEIEKIKDDKAAFEAYGIQWGINTCKTLLEAGVQGLHFYCLNQDKFVTQVLKGLDLLQEE